MIMAGEGFPGGPAPWSGQRAVSHPPFVPVMNFSLCVPGVSVELGKNEWGGALSCLGS